MSSPPPDLLLSLIRQFGAYSEIPPDAWSSYDQALIDWKLERGIGAFDNYDRGNQVVFDAQR